MYYNKFLKYKVKYNKMLKETIANSLNNIENVLLKLDKIYLNLKTNYVQQIQTGGRMKEYDSDKIHKYKKFIKDSKIIINYYKNMAEQYYMNTVSLNSQYIKMLNILRDKRMELQELNNRMEILNLDNSHNKDKLQIIETTMALLEKNINKDINLELNIKTVPEGKGYKVQTIAFDNIIPLNQSESKQIGGKLSKNDFFTGYDEQIKTIKKELEGLQEDDQYLDKRLRTTLNKLKEKTIGTRANSGVINSSNNILHIKGKIELLVSQLEKAQEGNVDLQKILNDAREISPLIEKIQSKKLEAVELLLETEKTSKTMMDIVDALMQTSAATNGKDGNETINMENLSKQQAKIKELSDRLNDRLIEVNQRAGETSVYLSKDINAEQEENQPVKITVVDSQNKKFVSDKGPNLFRRTRTPRPAHNRLNSRGGSTDIINDLSIQGGGKLQEKYEEKLKEEKLVMIRAMNRTFADPLVIRLSPPINETTNLTEIKTYLDYYEFDSKMIQLLDINELFSFLNLLSDYVLLLRTDTYELLSEAWTCFKDKATDYYENLLNKSVIYDFNLQSEATTITTKQDKQKYIYKICKNPIININLGYIKILTIEKLNDTYIFFKHLIYALICQRLLILTKSVDSDIPKILKLEGIKEKLIQDKEFLPYLEKSNLISFKHMPSNVPLLVQSGGNSFNIHDYSEAAINKYIQEAQKYVVPLETLSPELLIYKEGFQFINSELNIIQDQKPDDGVLIIIDNTYKKIENVIETMKQLVLKIINKLNELKPGTDVSAAIGSDDSGITSFVLFLELIKKSTLTPASGSAANPASGSAPGSAANPASGSAPGSTPGSTQSLASVEYKNGDKPRLDPFRIKLEECLKSLKPYNEKVVILERLIKIESLKTEVLKKGPDMYALFQVYSKIKSEINRGINNYIKTLQLIIITTEFPRSQYSNDKCKYELIDVVGKDEVEYKYIGDVVNENDDSCKSVFFPGKIAPSKGSIIIKYPAHGTFFDTNSSNKSIIENEIIGINKLFESSNNTIIPYNYTDKIMESLGASGTGKSYRYFGSKSDKGIISSIVKSNLDKEIPVELAYFICYGQIDDLKLEETPTIKDNIKFKELLMFFNYNIIKGRKYNVSVPVPPTGNNPGSDIDKNLRYIPYIQELKSETNINNYSDFYVNLVTKKLKKIDYNTIKNFVENGANFPIFDKTLSGENFREILEKTTETTETTETNIWYKITNNEDIEEIFDNLMDEQKNINTILPTKNNVESSRCHTCILLRTKHDGKNKYIPLFDMAGTENIKGMYDFYNQLGPDPAKPFVKRKIAKIMKTINTITQVQNLNLPISKDSPDPDEKKKYASLEYIVKDAKMIGYLQTGGIDKKNKVFPNLSDDLKEIDSNDYNDYASVNFLNKVVKEGYYINHTIAILIFIMACVGKSTRSSIVQNTLESSILNDSFNDILDDVLNAIRSNVLNSDDPESINTRLLTEGKKFNNILSCSCIWAQVMCSFLYWNEDTNDSKNARIDKMCKTTINFDPVKVPISDIKDDTYCLHELINDPLILKNKLSQLKKINKKGFLELYNDIKQSIINFNALPTLIITNNNIIYKDTKIVLDKLTQLNSEYDKSETSGASGTDDIVSKIMTHLITANFATFGNLEKINNHFNETKKFITTPLDIEQKKSLNKHLLELLYSTDTTISNQKIIQLFDETTNDIKTIYEIFGSSVNLFSNPKYTIIFKTFAETDFAAYSSIPKTNRKSKLKMYNFLIVLNNFIKYLNTDQQASIPLQTQTPGQKITSEFKLLKTKLETLNKFINDTAAGINIDLTLVNLDEFVNVLNILYLYNIDLSGEKIINHKEYYQMRRVQNGEVSPANFLLLFLVTGQNYKHFMVKETMDLVIAANTVSNK